MISISIALEATTKGEREMLLPTSGQLVLDAKKGWGSYLNSSQVIFNIFQSVTWSKTTDDRSFTANRRPCLIWTTGNTRKPWHSAVTGWEVQTNSVWTRLYSSPRSHLSNCPYLAQGAVLPLWWCNVCDVALTFVDLMTGACSVLHTHIYTHHTHTPSSSPAVVQRQSCPNSLASTPSSSSSSSSPSSSIHHHSLHHFLSQNTQQLFRSSASYIHNKSIPPFASWGVCLSKWLSGLPGVWQHSSSGLKIPNYLHYMNEKCEKYSVWERVFTVHLLSVGPPGRRCLVGTFGRILEKRHLVVYFLNISTIKLWRWIPLHSQTHTSQLEYSLQDTTGLILVICFLYQIQYLTKKNSTFFLCFGLRTLKESTLWLLLDDNLCSTVAPSFKL